MNAEDRKSLFERVRYDLHMAYSLADQINHERSPADASCLSLHQKICKCHSDSLLLIASFKEVLPPKKG